MHCRFCSIFDPLKILLPQKSIDTTCLLSIFHFLVHYIYKQLVGDKNNFKELLKLILRCNHDFLFKYP
jgi:hypothetical protein